MWYVHLAIIFFLPVVAFLVASIWRRCVVDDWWTPTWIINGAMITSVIYSMIYSGYLLSKLI